MNIPELESSKAKYLRCENGVAYYALNVPYSNLVYSFPIPLNSIHDDVLKFESPTIYFMDYINQAIQEGTLIKEAA